MQVTAMDDPEPVVISSNDWLLEAGCSETVGDRDDDLPAELWEMAEQAVCRPWRVHDDGLGGGGQPPHLSHVTPPVEAARIEPHLVQRPRVLKIRDPGQGQLARNACSS